MASTRIIPGVSVAVVKEVVPRQLAPTGVLGLIGLVETEGDGTVQRAASWSRFVELFGPGSAHSMPEARQALDNGVFELVVTPVSASAAAKAKATLNDAQSTRQALFTLDARAPGSWANGTRVTIEMNEPRSAQGVRTFNLNLLAPGASEPETHTRLTTVPGTPRYIVDVLQNDSTLVTAQASQTLVGLPQSLDLTALPAQEGRTAPSLTLQNDAGAEVLTVRAKLDVPRLAITVERDASGARIAVFQQTDAGFEEADPDELDNIAEVEAADATAYTIQALAGTYEFAVAVTNPKWPVTSGDGTLTEGKDANAQTYRRALTRLEDEADVDMVLPAIQDFSNVDHVVRIYSSVISHCATMSEDSKGRIGFGQVPPTGAISDHVEMTGNLVSDRFVMTAPHGVVGAVAGLVGGLSYFRSPTFKTVSGLGALKRNLIIEEQRELLRGYIVPVAVQHGLGLVVVRGLTTDGDQISVRRVADRAVRGVQSIGALFIGRLNNADGRSSLKQKLTEFFLQMEKEGAIVPSTDQTDPAFKVDVYSSQQDFALGIVRVDIAVRPVRAIDYIYATILVQV